MDRAGESVSLSFTGMSTLFLYNILSPSHVLLHPPGTQVTLEFLYDRVGREAQIAIDGQNVAQLSTYQNGALVLNGDCNPLSWSSNTLPPASHTLTVTALDPPANVTLPGWLDFRTFR